MTNSAAREAWNGDSGLRWVADADRRDAVLAPVATALFEAARLATPESVLDVGCGCGATTIEAAKRVAPGAVTGADISSPMLEVGRRRSNEPNTEFVQADAQVFAFAASAFDAVISRFGTMFFDNPVAAFANLHRATAASGRLCIATWQPLVANPWLMVPGAALLRYGTLPETSATEPGMFAQSEPRIVERVLADAGWASIDIQPRTVTLRLGDDPADAVDYLTDTGIARAVLETVAADKHADAIAAVTEVLGGHTTPAGVFLDAGINVIAATAT
jgi:ubiquinone/menaquinone biosynthesis C-methylase UbiE